MAKSIDPKSVKSALRALEVLEFFNHNRPSASVNDIARHYNYPQSSTSELMNCLVALGYLRRDRNGRRFAPSSRVAALGAWVQPRLFRSGQLYHIMDDLAAETNSSVVLANINFARLQHIHIVADPEAHDAIALEDPAASLIHSAEGLAILSTFPLEEARRLIHRLNSEIDEPFRVRQQDVVAALEMAAAKGYVVKRQDERLVSIAVALPYAEEGERLVLGLRPRAPGMHESDLVRALTSRFHARLGPVAVNELAPAETRRRAV